MECCAAGGKSPRAFVRGLCGMRLQGRLIASRSYPTFRNLCSERRLSGRGLSLKVCGQLVHDTSPT
jgi:hypothetical protein